MADNKTSFDAYKEASDGAYEMDELTGELKPVSNGTDYPSATQTSGQEKVVTTPQVDYKHDWGSGMSIRDAYNQGAHSLADIVDDRRKWGLANNKPIDYFEIVDALPDNHDRNKTKEQNEDDIKKAERKEKFDKIGNFLTHLGNFVGAVGFGGLNIKQEDPVQFTERQQRLRDKTESLRRAYNKEWLSNLYRQLAADRQAEVAKANAEYKETLGDVAQQKANSQAAKNEAITKWYNAKTGQIEELTPAQLEKLQEEAERIRKQGNAAVQNANTGSYNAETRRMAENRRGSGGNGKGKAPVITGVQWVKDKK